MAVVEGGNRLYRAELASAIKHALCKTEYSILGIDDHVHSMRPKFG